MTPEAEDWRIALAQWAQKAHLDDAEKDALDGLLKEIGPTRPPTREELAAQAERWAFIRRWPIEPRLMALRILDELGTLDALKRNDPETYHVLVAELRGDA